MAGSCANGVVGAFNQHNQNLGTLVDEPGGDVVFRESDEDLAADDD